MNTNSGSATKQPAISEYPDTEQGETIVDMDDPGSQRYRTEDADRVGQQDEPRRAAFVERGRGSADLAEREVGIPTEPTRKPIHLRH